MTKFVVEKGFVFIHNLKIRALFWVDTITDLTDFCAPLSLQSLLRTYLLLIIVFVLMKKATGTDFHSFLLSFFLSQKFQLVLFSNLIELYARRERPLRENGIFVYYSRNLEICTIGLQTLLLTSLIGRND